MKKLHIILLAALGVVGLATTFQDSGNLFTFTGPVISTSSTTNGPAANELATAGWIRNLLVTGQILYNSGTTNASGFDNPTFAYVATIPTNGSRTYLSAVCTNNAYIGSVMTTNTYQSIGGDIVISPYICSINGSGSSGYTLHAEVYATYDKTNIFGDWESGIETIYHGVTNKYSFVVPVPQYTSTNTTGFYIVRRLKINAKTGTDDIMLHYGTNFPSSISIPGQNSAGANWVAQGNTNSTLAGTATVGSLVVSNSITASSSTVNTLYLTGMTSNSVPVFDGNTNLVTSAVSTNDLQMIKGLSTMTSSWAAYSAGSNYVADLSLKSLLFNMTTNVNLIHTTNGTANFSTSVPYSSSIKIINNSGTNFSVKWPSTWHTVGTLASPFTLTNGDFCAMAIEFVGPTTSQTNNWIGVAYKQY